MSVLSLLRFVSALHRMVWASLLLGLVFACGNQAVAQPAETVLLFEEGIRLYNEGQYPQALQQFEQVLNDGYESSALYYNLGNTCFRLDEPGLAILYYERARRLSPNDAQLLHNLSIARAQVKAPFATVPTPLWKIWWKRYIVRIGALPFFAVGFVFYCVAALLISHHIWTRSPHVWRRRVLTLVLLLGFTLLVLAFGTSLDTTLDRQAVIMEDQTRLHETPNDNAPGTTNIPEGVLIQILQQEGQWFEVRLPNGVTGWIMTRAATEV